MRLRIWRNDGSESGLRKELILPIRDEMKLDSYLCLEDYGFDRLK